MHCATHVPELRTLLSRVFLENAAGRAVLRALGFAEIGRPAASL
jgi:hypothetical protein